MTHEKPVFKTQQLPASVLNGTAPHSNSQSPPLGVPGGNYELTHQVKSQVHAEEFLPFLTSPYPSLLSGWRAQCTFRVPKAQNSDTKWNHLSWVIQWGRPSFKAPDTRLPIFYLHGAGGRTAFEITHCLTWQKRQLLSSHFHTVELVSSS